MTSVSACGIFSKNKATGNDLKFDIIVPDESDYDVMSNNLVDQILKHNCKLQPSNEACK